MAKNIHFKLISVVVASEYTVVELPVDVLHYCHQMLCVWKQGCSFKNFVEINGIYGEGFVLFSAFFFI